MMNYLAHAYFSYNDPEALVGNMISDFVKGRKKFDYSIGIQNGITLHRLIDRYTDDHPATKAAKEVFRPTYRLYSGAFIDVVYDHFLALDDSIFTETSLQRFAQATYKTLDNYFSSLPLSFQAIFPYMKKHDWLYHYRFRQGIEKSFGGLVRRSTYLTESDSAAMLLAQHYTTLQDCYKSFMSDAKLYIRTEFEKIVVQ
jgi:acyl carrier protein phosphodiesterase